MYTGAKYIGKVEIPTIKLEELAIKEITRSTGYQEDLVSKIHNFQWKISREAIDNNMSLDIASFFRMNFHKKKAFEIITKLMKKRQFWIKKSNDVHSKVFNGVNRRKFYESKVLEVEAIIKTYEDKLGE